MKTDKRTFVFHLDWTDILNGQPDDIRLAVYDAIVDYVKSGNEPKKGTAVYLAFKFIKYQIDKDAVRYAEVCDKRANAGRQHKGNQYTKRLEQNGTNGTNVPKMEQMEQNGTNGTDNDYEYDSDNDIDIIESNSSSKISCSIESGANYNADKSATRKQPAKTLEERQNDFMWKIAEVGKGVYPDEMLRAFFDYWSEHNENGKKMLFEMKKTFDIKKRLATWASRENDNQFKHTSNGNRNNPNSADYVPTERIVAAGLAMANANR